MKRFALSMMVVALAAILVSCPQPFSTRTGSSDGTASARFLLPPDEVHNTPRPSVVEFTFETLVPVALDLDVTLYGRDENGALVNAPLDLHRHAVVATVKSPKGKVVYSAKVPGNGALRANVYVPAAAQDMTLHLAAAGFDARVVTLARMAEFSRVGRTMALQQSEAGSHAAMLSVSGLVDTDGDGVPDVYDAFPNDPDSAFVLNVPAEGVLTIAFEDLFGRANAGDADYNDFIGEYRIQEILNADNHVTSIRVDATARVKLAGYNHRFGIRIDEFEGKATLTRTYIDRYGIARSDSLVDITAPVEIELFEYSATAIGSSAWFTLEFNAAQRTLDSAVDLSAPPYNPWVIVRNTGHDIHLIDREPLSELINSKNPDDRFVDRDGFPWALLVPSDWEYPAEGRRIDSDEWYPRFTDWRLSAGERHADWYNYKGEPWDGSDDEPVVPVVVGIDPVPTADTPVRYPAVGRYQLLVEGDDGSAPIYFRTLLVPPAWIVLDPATGAVAVDASWLADGQRGQATVGFYASLNADRSADAGGGSSLDTPYEVTFHVERDAAGDI